MRSSCLIWWISGLVTPSLRSCRRIFQGGRHSFEGLMVLLVLIGSPSVALLKKVSGVRAAMGLFKKHDPWPPFYKIYLHKQTSLGIAHSFASWARDSGGFVATCLQGEGYHQIQPEIPCLHPSIHLLSCHVAPSFWLFDPKWVASANLNVYQRKSDFELSVSQRRCSLFKVA